MQGRKDRCADGKRKAGSYLDPSDISAIRLSHGRLGRCLGRGVDILVFAKGK